MTDDTKPAETPEEMHAEREAERPPFDFDEPEAVEVPDAGGEVVADVEEQPAAANEPVTSEDIDLLVRAKLAGLTLEEAKSVGDTQTLRRVVDTLEKQSKATTGHEFEDGKEADDFNIDLDPDVWDDDLLKAMTSMKDHFNTQIGEMRKAVEGIVGHVELERAQVGMERFDQQISKLGDEYGDMLGKGSTSSLTKGSAPHSARMDILKARDALEAAFPGLSPDELFSRAAGSVLGSHQATIARKKVETDIKKRQSQMTTRPTHTDSGETNTVRAAEMAVARLMKDRPAISDISEEDAGL